MRSKTGEKPSVDELASRFPNLDKQRVLKSDEYLIKTQCLRRPDRTNGGFRRQ